MLCSSSTGEYGGENIGVYMGDSFLSTLLFVDDIIDMATSIEDCIKAHENAILFGRRKKLKYSSTKCHCMAMNYNGEVPCLEIDNESSVVPSEEIVYLGDIFNMWGNNDGLIDDRLKRGSKAIITIAFFSQFIYPGKYIKV